MRIFLFGLLLALNLAATQAASFPCGKASTKVEKLICNNPRLSIMDEEMASRYREVLASAGSPMLVRREQREWLNGDRNTCRSERCLLIAYAARLEALGTESNAGSRSSNGEVSRSPHDSQNGYRTNAAASGDEVTLIQNGGVFEVPVIVNDVLKINFIIDSGASDVSISPDVALTLLKAGTISQAEWLPGAHYAFADGSSAKSERFKIRSLRIGGRILHDVTCSIAQKIEAPLLLGQSALHKLGSYQIDYRRGLLIIK